jgi:hypothetical protein
MAEYDARANELEARYAEEYRQAIDRETRGAPPIVHASWIRLQTGLEVYAGWRDRALAEGIALLEPDSGATAAGHQERWASHFQRMGAEAYTQLNDLGEDADAALQAWVTVIYVQETLFFGQLSKFTLARVAGQIREWMREVEQESGTLEDKWRELAGLDERADAEIAALRVQFLRELEAAVANLLGWGRKVEAVTKEVVKGGAEYDDKSSPDPSFGPLVVAGITTVDHLQTHFDVFVQEAQRLYDDETPLHAIFEGLRERTGAYYATMEEASEAAFDEACRESMDRAAQCPTDAQREDARKFLESASREVEPLLSEHKTAFDTFYDRFDGRFLGEVSDQTAEFLADQEFFNKFWKEFEGTRVPEAIQQVLADIERAQGVPMDGLEEETRAMLRTYFEEKLEPHKDRLRSYDSNFFRRLYDVTGMGVKLAFDKFKRTPGHEK